MRDIFTYLEDRAQEFNRHFAVARMLESRIDETHIEDDIHIEVRHINTIKSSLLVHLYNVVEAVTTRTLEHVGQVVATERPGLWTNAVLKEWVRAEFWNTDERLSDGALLHLTNLSDKLVSGEKADAFNVKGVPGSWNDNAIKKVAERLGCRLILSPEVSRAAYERVYRNDTTALGHLAIRRNHLAHGNLTFEEGASDLTLKAVEELADRVLPYLKAVTESYKAFLDNKDFLKNEEEAA